MSTMLSDSLSNEAFSLPRDRSEPCISVTNLKKQYGKDSAYTLNGVSFNVRYGTVFGFLGPNGAGKTTTLKILTTLLSPSSGSAQIFGKDLVKKQSEIKRKIGVVSQDPSFEANLTVEKALNLYGLLWGLRDSRARKDKVKEILKTFDLESIKNSKNDELSIGQRRRVQLAREFMHDMDLLFLDEPTVGLDPSARRMLLDYIKKHVMSGLTVFFTTHYMDEVERNADHVAIIDHGKILICDTPEELKRSVGAQKVYELHLREEDTAPLTDRLRRTPGVASVENFAQGLRVFTTGSDGILPRIVELTGDNLRDIAVNETSLETVFIKLTGRDLRE